MYICIYVYIVLCVYIYIYVYIYTHNSFILDLSHYLPSKYIKFSPNSEWNPSLFSQSSTVNSAAVTSSLSGAAFGFRLN